MYHLSLNEKEIDGAAVWDIIRGGQTIEAEYEEGKTDIFRLSNIASVNPICKLGTYQVSLHIEERYFDIIEDVVPAPCALEGHILMVSDVTVEGCVRIFKTTGEALKSAMYSTYSHGAVFDIEFYDGGELMERRYFTVCEVLYVFADDSLHDADRETLRTWLEDDKEYLIFIREDQMYAIKPLS